MAVLLRLALGVPAIAVVILGSVVLAAADAPPGLLLAGALAVALLAVPPLLAGAFCSWWAFDPEAARRLRVWIVGLAAVQLAAAAGLVAVVVVVGAVPGGVVVIAAALVQDAVSVLLGRAARRVDRREHGEVDPGGLRVAIDRAWRRGGIGAFVGLAAGLVAAIAAGLAVDDGPGVLPVLVVGLFTLCGGSLALTVGSLSAAARVRQLLGDRYGDARRIGRAVVGKPEALTEDEEARAVRYAAVAPAWLRLQAAGQLLSAATSGLVLVVLAVTDDALRAVLVVASAVVIGTAVLAAALLVRQIRRVRAFASAHPPIAP